MRQTLAATRSARDLTAAETPDWREGAAPDGPIRSTDGHQSAAGAVKQLRFEQHGVAAIYSEPAIARQIANTV